MVYIVRYVNVTRSGDYIIEKCSSHNKQVTYIPKHLILAVDYYETVKDWMENNICECTSPELKEKLIQSLTLLPPFPMYRVTVANKIKFANIQLVNSTHLTVSKSCEYILDPSEHEHMERYLAGTDDPMYDFVHELRHNPRALPTSTELAEATERFNKRPKIE